MTTIITNYSLTPGAEPAATDLEVGELGLNAADGTLFTSSDGNDVVPVTDWVAGTLPDDLTNRNTGNVGIGTADPAQRLSVAGNVEIVSDTGTIALLNSYRPDQMVDTNIFARWSGNGKDSLDTENRVGARINMVASGTWTNAVTPSYMGFETGRAGSNIVEAMRIDDTGCVLIGLDDNGGYTTKSSNTSLVVANGAINDIQPASAANELVINSGTNSGMSIISGDTSQGRIVFGRSTDNDAFDFNYDHATDQMHMLARGKTIMEGWYDLGGGVAGVLIGASINPPNSGWRLDETGYAISAKDGNGVIQVGHIDFNNATVFQGNIATTNTRVYYNTTSDYRLKENVVPLINGLNRLNELQPKQFNFIRAPGHTVDGFIAHEVAEVVPDAVNGEKDGEQMQSLDASVLIPVLVAAIQELSAKVEALS